MSPYHYSSTSTLKCLSTFFLMLHSSIAFNIQQLNQYNNQNILVFNQNRQRQVQSIYTNTFQQQKQSTTKLKLSSSNNNNNNSNNNKSANVEPKKLFLESHASLLNGMARINKDEFTSLYDSGPPMDKGTNTKAQDAIVIYNKNEAIPSSNPDITQAVQYGSSSTEEEEEEGEKLGIMPLLSTQDALENCDTMNVVTLGNPGNTNQCTILLHNYENYYVQRYMRVNADATTKSSSQENKKLNHNLPLQPVSRGYTSNGQSQFIPPDSNSIAKHWKTLQRYFNTLDETLAKLRPIAKKVAVKNTIIVMTCNMGQSELLMNFVCNAKAKGLSIDNVLVFPTDVETKELAEGLGLTTFYDEKNFEDMPETEAQHYGDSTFIAMMFAKVVCVQLINHLQYDLLFQDVDVVWYTNPLTYFQNTNNPYYNFDMYFQDDGAHTARYAPYSANSGFYYVRNNAKTRYLFASLLYSGDMIIQSHSHQQALVQLMAEHQSLFGLKVKVLSRDMDEFPGGWHYHRRNKDYMKKVVKSEIVPIIFHMSWTKNKDNKLKFFQQMGQWYVKDVCIAQSKHDILKGGGTDTDVAFIGDGTDGGDMDGSGDLVVGENGEERKDSLIEPCCLAEPNIVCHYRDKPSKFPCTDKDPIDEGRPSFW